MRHQRPCRRPALRPERAEARARLLWPLVGEACVHASSSEASSMVGSTADDHLTVLERRCSLVINSRGGGRPFSPVQCLFKTQGPDAPGPGRAVGRCWVEEGAKSTSDGLWLCLGRERADHARGSRGTYASLQSPSLLTPARSCGTYLNAKETPQERAPTGIFYKACIATNLCVYYQQLNTLPLYLPCYVDRAVRLPVTAPSHRSLSCDLQPSRYNPHMLLLLLLIYPGYTCTCLECFRRALIYPGYTCTQLRDGTGPRFQHS